MSMTSYKVTQSTEVTSSCGLNRCRCRCQPAETCNRFSGTDKVNLNNNNSQIKMQSCWNRFVSLVQTWCLSSMSGWSLHDHSFKTLTNVWTVLNCYMFNVKGNCNINAVSDTELAPKTIRIPAVSKHAGIHSFILSKLTANVKRQTQKLSF